MQVTSMPKQSTPVPSSEVQPDPALEKRTRRVFPTEYKLKILAQADQCAHGEPGPLLRREKLYSNQLQQWRREFAEHGVAGLSKSAPGPSPKLSAEQKEIEKLKRENQRLREKLSVANDCLDLQKKALSMLDHMNNGNDK